MPKATTPNALIAAATRVTLRDPKLAVRQMAKRQDWHAEAFGYFDEVPEIKEGIRYRGNQLGKLKLFVAAPNPANPDGELIPATDPASGVPPAVAGAAEAELGRLRSVMGGQSELLRMLDMNWELVGDCYLVGFAARDEVRDPLNPSKVISEAQPENWMIHSISEVQIKGTGTSAKTSILADENDKDGRVLDPEMDTIIRLYLRHPQWANKADCSMRGLLGECRVLQVLSQQLLAHAYRALSAGFFTVPNELSFSPLQPGTPGEATTDPLTAVLDEVLSGPVEDPTAPSTVQPGLLRGPAEYLKPDVLRLIRFYDPDVVRDIEARIEARVRRIARGMSIPVEKVMGFQQCVSTDTEILTAEGWRTASAVVAGDQALTLNHVTGMAEWQPIERVSVFPAANQPMLSMEGKSHSSLSTLNHRWPVMTQRGFRRWYDSADLNTNCRLIPGAPSSAQPTEAKWSDALVEMVAWYYTEGTDSALGGALVYQSERANPAKVAMIRRALTELAGPYDGPTYTKSKRGIPGWTETPVNDCIRFRLNKPLAEMLRVCAPGKVPTFEFLRSLTVAQVELFVQRSVDGDGFRCVGGGFQFHQKDERRSDAFEFACILSGRAVSRSVSRGSGGFKNSIRYNVRPRRAATQRIGYGIKQETVIYTGDVWCPTVANGTWLARRNGTAYFTGNTTYANADQINQDEFEDFFRPSADASMDALTYAFLQPQLLEAGGQVAEWADRLRVWYDPADLIAQPDTESHAVEAHDRNAISNAALRKALGFGEDDAPEPLELLIKAGLRRGILTADLTLALLNLLGIPIDVPQGGTADPTGETTDQMAATAQLLSLLSGARPITAASRPAPTVDYGRRLTDIDRDLRTRLLVSANAAMGAALTRAANRLRTRTNGSDLRASLSTVPRRDWFAHLGPSLVADVMGDEDPMSGAWVDLEADFMAWGAASQAEARSVAGQATGQDQSDLEDRQSDDLGNAWAWLAAALSALAVARLWNPDPAAPEVGEHDPSLMVPAGLIRQAIARAGGAQGLTTGGTGEWVVLTDGGTRPAGGIGTGEVIRGALRDGGAQVEGYVWEYGPAYRARPFEEHQALDGTFSENFDSDKWSGGGWTGFGYWMPGDHDGCRCDARPVVLPAGEAD